VCHMTHQFHPPLFCFPNNINGDYKLWSSSLYNFHQPLATSHLLG
jgi:hypothetical protein